MICGIFRFLELKGNANFKTSTIEVNEAESIVFNMNSNEIEAMGFKDFSINGKLQIKGNKKPETLRFKLGSDTAYLE